ncbi:hypothetical protein GIB67_010614, partial [Kingdonia uniflora]
MSAPPGSIGNFGYPRHQSMPYDSYHQPRVQGYAPHFPSGYLTQVLGNATGSISSKLGESQSSQVLANATRSISLMLSESQSSKVLANGPGFIRSMLGKSQSSQ